MPPDYSLQNQVTKTGHALHVRPNELSLCSVSRHRPRHRHRCRLLQSRHPNRESLSDCRSDAHRGRGASDDCRSSHRSPQRRRCGHRRIRACQHLNPRSDRHQCRVASSVPTHHPHVCSAVRQARVKAEDTQAMVWLDARGCYHHRYRFRRFSCSTIRNRSDDTLFHYSLYRFSNNPPLCLPVLVLKTANSTTG